MEDSSSRKKVFGSLVLGAVLVLFQTNARTQETMGRAGKAVSPVGPAVQSRERGEDAGLLRLARRLAVLRKIGDLEGAARIFVQLFPPEPSGDPVFALKTGAVLPTNRPDSIAWDAKNVVAAEGSHPVFISPEHEKDPSADVRISSDRDRTIYSAAEQWAGDRPGMIRVRKSTDRGLTWPETLIIGDGRAVTHPSLRLVADDTIGVAYVKEWDGQDGDIYFARLDAAMSSAAEIPVALSLSDQSDPSIATDREAYISPYIYIAYADREGPAGSVKFRISQDLGATWSRAETIASFPWPVAAEVETAMAFDPDRSALHVAYTYPQGGSTGIAVVTSRDFGASWSKTVLLTTAGDGTASCPTIAARGGTVIVAYEHAIGDRGPDVGLAYSPDSGRSWTRGRALASSAAAETSPDIRSSDGTGPARFFASYVEANDRVIVLSAAGAAPESWTTELIYPEGESPLALGSAIVLPMPGRDGEESAGILWTDTSADGDIYFSTSASMWILATLTVTPNAQVVPYTAGLTTIAVAKVGDGDVGWNAAVTSGGTWLSVQSGASGTNAGTIVAAFVANPDTTTRMGTIQVTPTDGITPAVTATVTQSAAAPGALSVMPAGGLTSSGIPGGPFTPSSQTYTLLNTGGTPLDWTATKIQAWTALSATSGTLAAGATTTVTVSFSTAANSLAPGTFSDTVTFTNATNGSGTTIRAVSLTVIALGALSVSPAGGLTSDGTTGGPFTPSSQTYTLQNTGGTAINWTSTKTQAWTALSAASGALAPGASATVTVSFSIAANSLTPGTYSDTVTFTNATNGSGTTTRAVSLTVIALGALSVTPAGGLTSSGPAGGPFTPDSVSYTLQNTGGTTISWTASKTQAWTALSRISGNLAAGSSTTLDVTINSFADALAAGTYNDTISFTNTTGGTGSTTRPVTLTVSSLPGVLAVAPTGGLTSSGPAGGPFTPSSQTYTLQNTGGAAVNWTSTKTQAWTTLSAASGALAAGATTTVTVSVNTTANSLAPGTFSDTVTFTNVTNGSGTTIRAVSLTVIALGALSVTPAGGLTSSGPAGGPFTPDSVSYTLQNTGGATISWTASKTQAWTALSRISGNLAAGSSTTLDVTINSFADALAAGTYNDTITFTNTTGGTGSTTRPVTLTVSSLPGVLAVTPTGGLTSSGPAGGPFTPSSQNYTLQNTGGTAVNWTSTKTQAWTTLSAASGALAAGATTTVTVSVNTTANSLALGAYNDTITFTNVTNGSGNTTRVVALTVNPGPTLSVFPANRDVAFAAGTTTFAVSNGGGGTFNWTAAVVVGGDWLTIASGSIGTGSGTISAAYAANPTASPRVGTIRVTADVAIRSPQDVTVTQGPSSLLLGLTAERLVDRAWIIRKEYAKLTVTVVNPSSVLIGSYRISRMLAGADPVVVTEVAGSTVGSSWTYNDLFPKNGMSYTYRILAFDAQGNVIGASNDITI